MKTKEHLTINNDGSGTIETETIIPGATISMIDMTMGEMMKGMSQAFSGENPPPQPESIAEEMFGNKDQILKTAQNAGLNIEFLAFDKEKRGEDLYVHYKIKFDDLNKLMSSGLIGTKFSLNTNDQGKIICSFEEDPSKAQEAQMQMQQFEGFKQSEDFQKMPPEVKEQFTKAMKDFSAKFVITFPGKIEKATGLFKQVDDFSAEMSFSGDLLNDPELIKNMYGLSSETTELIADASGLTINKSSNSNETQEKEPASSSETSLGSDITIMLKTGTTIEGKLLEKTDDYLRIETDGIPVTYYLDEIEAIK